MRLLIIPAFTMSLSIGAIAVFGEAWGIPESLEAAIEWLHGFGDWLWLVAVGVILADSFLMMPSDAAMLVLGLVYGTWLGGALSGAASVAGGMLAFGVMRALGEGFALRVVGERDLLRARAFFARWGAYAVAAARAVGGPAEAVIVLAGLSHMRWQTVFVALCAGGIPTGILKAALGSVADRYPLSAILAAIVLAAVTTWIAGRLIPVPQEAESSRVADPA